jgi:DNA-binding NarL/FixJ family response regulator
MPTIVSAKLKELEAARAKLASLEEAVRAELNKELAGLPAKYGFDSADEFVAAVRAASGGRGRGRGRPARAAKPAGRGAARRRRAVITDETRTQVKKLVEGGKTGAEIAKQLKISLPSVQNIKKALGLVKKR